MAASGSPGSTKEAAEGLGPGPGPVLPLGPGPWPPLLWFLGILRLPRDLQYFNMGPKLLILKTFPWWTPTPKSLSSYKIEMAKYSYCKEYELDICLIKNQTAGGFIKAALLEISCVH